MSKKVLIVSASPRKNGNSDTLCNQFQKGALESGNLVEKVFLKDYNINYCMGCGVCNNTHVCVQKDDMSAILNKMVEADVLVFATPVYFYSMDAQLKTFIDRTVPRYTEVRDKEVYYIMTAADTDERMLNSTVEAIRGFTRDCLDGAIEKGIIYGVGAWNMGEIVNTPAYSQAYQMGKAV